MGENITQWSLEEMNRAKSKHQFILVSPNSASLVYMIDAQNIWATNPNVLFHTGYRIAGIPEDIYTSLANLVNQEDIDALINSAITSQNYSTDYAEIYKKEISDYESWRRGVIKSNIATPGATLLNVITAVNPNIPSTGGTKQQGGKGRKAQSLYDRIQALPAGKVLDVTKLSEDGTGAVRANPPTGRSKKYGVATLPIISSSLEKYLLAISMLPGGEPQHAAEVAQIKEIFARQNAPVAIPVRSTGVNLPIPGIPLPVRSPGANLPIPGIPLPSTGTNLPIPGIPLPSTGTNLPIPGVPLPVRSPGANLPIPGVPLPVRSPIPGVPLPVPSPNRPPLLVPPKPNIVPGAPVGVLSVPRSEGELVIPQAVYPLYSQAQRNRQRALQATQLPGMPTLDPNVPLPTTGAGMPINIPPLQAENLPLVPSLEDVFGNLSTVPQVLPNIPVVTANIPRLNPVPSPVGLPNIPVVTPNIPTLNPVPSPVGLPNIPVVTANIPTLNPVPSPVGLPNIPVVTPNIPTLNPIPSPGLNIPTLNPIPVMTPNPDTPSPEVATIPLESPGFLNIPTLPTE